MRLEWALGAYSREEVAFSPFVVCGRIGTERGEAMPNRPLLGGGDAGREKGGVPGEVCLFSRRVDPGCRSLAVSFALHRGSSKWR